MLREIKKKLIILENRKPYSIEVCTFVQELNMLDWIHSSIRLDGSVLSREDVKRILTGEFIMDVGINEHAAIKRFRELIETVENMLAVSSSFNKDMLLSFQKILTGSSLAGFRKSNPVLVSINHNPPHPSEIDEQMEILMKWFYSEDMEINPILKAVCLHHRIIEIYPFDVGSESVARAAMYYFLMEKGYPVFEICMSDWEYNITVIEYLQREDPQPFYREAERSIYNKLELLMQLTAG